MSIEIQRRTPEAVSFALSGVDVSMANALRRIMLAEIPTLAVETVTFVENTTIFQDDYLAHRLGMVPLWAADPSTESATLRMEVSTADEERDITSRDLVCDTPGVEVRHCSKSGILLGKLMPHQRLSFTSTAKRGTGAEHAKWSAVSTARFSYKASIEIDQARFNTAASQRIADMCPKKVFDVEDGNLVVARSEACVFCGECTNREAQRLSGPRSVRVGAEPGVFMFEVESAGQYPAAEVVDMACEALVRKCDLLMDRVRNLPPPPATPPGTPIELSYQD